MACVQQTARVYGNMAKVYIVSTYAAALQQHTTAPGLLSDADGAVSSAEFWSFAAMVNILGKLVFSLYDWFESCPCHRRQTKPTKIATLLANARACGVQDAAGLRDHINGWRTCPMSGHRAPQLAAGALQVFYDGLRSYFATKVLFVTGELSDSSARACVMQNFTAAVSALWLVLKAHTQIEHSSCSITARQPVDISVKVRRCCYGRFIF